MVEHLFLATSDGLVSCRRPERQWTQTGRGLAGKQVTSVIAREGVILAGTTDGIFRSSDLGSTWQEASQGLAERHVRWLAYQPEVSDLEFAGLEPAGIFVSHDGGDSWRERHEVSRLRDQHGWFLPYSPRAGCVRGFAFNGRRAYAAVEVGGVLRSDDQGESWQLAEGSDGNPDLSGPPEPFIYPDVHSINTHPSSPDLVFAPTGGGFYRSMDGGKSWELLYDCYCRAVWVDPKDPRHIVLSPADGVDRNGRIELSRDGGSTWELASAGLEVPWRRGMVERFVQVGDDLLAVLSNGHLLSARIETLFWQRILPEIHSINAVATMVDED